MSRNNSDARKTLKELVDEIKKVFKKHSRSARDRAWSGLTSKRGKNEIDKLIINPSRTVNTTNSWLSYREWVERNKLD